MDTVSYLMGKKQGGSPTVLEEKDVTVTTNGEETITPSSGYNGISKVNLTTNVPTGITPTGTINITANADNIDVSTYASANVNVPSQKYKPAYLKTPFLNYTGNNLDYEIANLDVSNITDFSGFFQGCSNITSLDLTSWDVSKAVNADSNFFTPFSGCSSLQSLNIKNWDLSGIKSYRGMFDGLSSLTSLDLSGWTVYNLNRYNSKIRMFYGCTSLQFLDIRCLDLGNTITTYTGAMFGEGNSIVPANCEIIVGTTADKTYINNNFSWLTNVKTVAEYEAE